MSKRSVSAFGLAMTLVLALGWALTAQAAPPPETRADPRPNVGPVPSASVSAADSKLGALAVQPGASGLSYRHVTTFGTAGAPYFEDTSHLNGPNALGTDGTNIWVTETNGLRALKFGPDGAFLKQIGKAGISLNLGNDSTRVEWDKLSDVTVDSSGNVWVVDENRNSITKFDSTGAFVSQLGTGWGTGNYQFQQPSGIAFDAAGNIYVGDRNNNRVQIYDSAGAFRATLGTTGTPGTGNYQFNQPWHVVVGADSRLYVADSRNNRVQIYDVTNPASPSYVGTLGTTGMPGNDNAHFSTTEGIAVDTTHIYATDGWNNRVQVFSRATLAYETTIGAGAPNPGSGDGQFHGPSDVAVDSSGNVYVADFFNSRVQKFSPTLTYVSKIGTTGVPYLTDNTHYFRPRGVAVATDGSYYVVENLGQRLIKRDAAGAFLWQIGSPGVYNFDSQHFINPTGVALDAAGRVHVTDGGNNRVQIYNPDGTFYSTLGLGWGNGQYQFANPSGIAIDAAGNIYVADRNNQRVQVYGADYAYKGTLGQSGVWGAANNQFNNPNGVAVDSAGTIYVADSNNNRVQVFDSNRAYVRTIGVTGENNCGRWPKDNEHFCNPASVAVDSDRRIYVGEWGYGVKAFDVAGAYLTTVGGGDWTRADQLRDSSGIAVDREGNLWVADAQQARVQKYARGVPGWVQSNLNGFGNPANERVSVLQAFDGKLYAGTSNPRTGAEVWRRGDDGAWAAVRTGGFGTTSNNTVGAMVEFGGKLYAGTSNYDSASQTSQGAQIWRSADGTTWEQVMTGGFGVPNAGGHEILGLLVYKGQIYASTWGGLWRSGTGDAGTWTNATGLGSLTGATLFGNYLYAGNFNNSAGGSVWRTTDGANWQMVSQGGFGNSGILAVYSLAAFDGKLYATTLAGDPNRPSTVGVQVWRCQATCSAPSDWTQVVNGGFGNARTGGTSSLRVLSNRLYLVVGNADTGIEVWRTATGDAGAWQRLGISGFGDSMNDGLYAPDAAIVFDDHLYIGTRNQGNGGETWQYADPRVFLPMVVKP